MMKVDEGHAQRSQEKSQGCRLGKAKQALLLIKLAFLLNCSLKIILVQVFVYQSNWASGELLLSQ